jgi:hypothetical protein
MKWIPILAALALGTAFFGSGDDGLVRRFRVDVDGKAILLEEGATQDLACEHAPGKTHRVRVSQAPTFTFRGADCTFDFDAAMTVAAGREDGWTYVSVEADSVVVQIRRFDHRLAKKELRELLAEVEGSYQADDFETRRGGSETRPFGEVSVEGIPIAGQDQDGVTFEHWLGHRVVGDETYVFEMAYDGEERMAALRYFGIVQRSFRIGPPPASAPTSRPG